MPHPILCTLSELDATSAKGPIRVERDGRAITIFVVRQGGRVFAYEDSCPHAFAPLEMEPDRFLDLSGTMVLCTMHGAHFDIATGACVLGPCKGRRLTPYPVSIRNGEVIPDPQTFGV